MVVSQPVQAFTPYVPTPMPTYTAPASTYTPAATTPQRSTPAPSAPVTQPQQGGVGGFIDRAGQAAQQLWNNQPMTLRPAQRAGGVTFMDRSVGRYDGNGNRVGGSGPAGVSPLQTATSGHALDEAGQLLNGVGEFIQNLPPIPLGIPGWNPLERAY